MSSTRAPRARSSAVAQAQKANKSSQTVWIVVGVIVVIALSAVLAIALAQEDGSSGSGVQVAAVEVSGDPIPMLAQTGVSEAVGAAAPEVSGTALDGSTMSITNDGRPRVMGFFTHWCNVCQAEVPIVSDWFNGGGEPDDVDFIAVNTEVRPGAGNYPPSRWYENEDWSVPTLLDDTTSSVARAYGLNAWPFWVVVDAEGDIVTQRSGALSVSEIEGLLEMARAGGA